MPSPEQLAPFSHAPVAALHVAPATQSALLAQLVLQLVASAQTKPPGQGAGVAPAHAEVAPSQLVAAVNIALAQLAVLHDVPDAFTPHAPALHRSPHGPGAQSECGSATPSTATHAPTLPDLLHE